MSDLYVPAARLRKPSWRDSRLLIGIVIVLASVVIGARVVAMSDSTVPVYAAGGALSSGHAVQAADLRVVQVHLGSGSADYMSAKTALPAGMVLSRSIGAGELIPKAVLTPAASLQRRPVVVPLTEPMPNGLVVGMTVDLWSSAKDAAAASSKYLKPEKIAKAVEVYSVSTPRAGLAGSDYGSVQVLLDENDVQSVLDALANGAKMALVPSPAGADDAGVAVSPAGSVLSTAGPIGTTGPIGKNG